MSPSEQSDTYSPDKQRLGPVSSYASAQTVDDLLRIAIDSVVSSGDRIEPGKGPALELRGVLLELRNPRSCLSRTETRGRLFSCLGELCWYLSGTRQADLITYYIPRYEELKEGEIVYGGYGPRL